MRSRALVAAAAAAGAVIAGTVASPAGASGAAASGGNGYRYLHVCGAPAAGDAACQAITRVPATAKPYRGGSSPSGYNPVNLQGAYALPSSTNGAGQTVAIVDAYNDPSAASDVNKYRSTFGITALTDCSTNPASCGSGPWFRKVSQTGTTSYPTSNGGWSQEISLDLDMVSAVCPKCNVLLVEATSASNANLGKAVDTAVSLGANEISNSYGGSEDTADASHYAHAGVAITASSGDSAYSAGPQSPADYPSVISVGGTSLKLGTGSTYGSESAWSGAGSGCSKYYTTTWQPGITGCAAPSRSIADVSAVADPNTGVSVYDTYSYQGLSGWLVFGGTSVSSPIMASVIALAGDASSYGTAGAQRLYTSLSSSNSHDVTSGSNGSCSGQAICTAVKGEDGPTGLGSPLGVTGF